MTARLKIVRCDIPGCDHDIIWTRTVAGKAMPVDAQPSDAGNILLNHALADPDGRPAAGVLAPAQAAGARAAGHQLRTHHRLSCVHPELWARQAGAHRRPGGRA